MRLYTRTTGQQDYKVFVFYPRNLKLSPCRNRILRHPIRVRRPVHVCVRRPWAFSYIFLPAYESKQSVPQVLLPIIRWIFSVFPFHYFLPAHNYRNRGQTTHIYICTKTLCYSGHHVRFHHHHHYKYNKLRTITLYFLFIKLSG